MTAGIAPRATLWSQRDFRRLWAAQAGSALGSRISRTALPVIGVLLLSANAAEMSVLSAVTVLPAIFVGLLFAGAIERAPKQRVMIAADVFRAVLLVSIPIAALSGALNLWLLDSVAFLQGAATSAFRIADTSFLPIILEADLLVEANARFESTDAVAEAAGPGLAGILIQVLGAPGAVLVDAASYLWSTFFLCRLRQRGVTPSAVVARQSVVTDIVIGWRACVATPLLRATLQIEILTSLSNGFFMALYMLLALRQMGLSPALVGLIVGVGGVSSLLAAFAAPALERRFALLPLLVVSLLIGQGADFLIALAPSAGRFGTAFLVAQQWFGDGFCTLYAIYAVSWRQRLQDVDVQARSSATFQVVAGLALPVGALMAGVLASRYGIQPCMIVAAVVGMASALTLIPAMRVDHDAAP